MAMSALMFKERTLHFWVLSVGVFMTYLAANTFLSPTAAFSKKHLWFLLIIGIVPTAFLIFNSVRSGHTYGLTQRYSGFSFPYVTVLASLALWQVSQLQKWLKWAVSVILLIQLFFIGQTLGTIYADRSLKYNYRTEARASNPHYAAAQKAIQLYQKGDTISLPAPLAKFDNPMDKTYLPYSVVDAQYFNLYLPKGGIFVQQLDTVNVNKIRLKKPDGKVIELIDLNGKRY